MAEDYCWGGAVVGAMIGVSLGGAPGKGSSVFLSTKGIEKFTISLLELLSTVSNLTCEEVSC